MLKVCFERTLVFAFDFARAALFVPDALLRVGVLLEVLRAFACTFAIVFVMAWFLRSSSRNSSSRPLRPQLDEIGTAVGAACAAYTTASATSAEVRASNFLAASAASTLG